MRSFLTLAIASIVSHAVHSETATVETLRISGAGSCLPYHVSYSPDTTETLIDFSTKPFEKVLVQMRNAEGFEKKVEAIPYSGLFGFKGSYSSATVKVGKCSFTLSHAPQVNETVQSQNQSASVKADEVRLKQIQQQMDQLILALSQTNGVPQQELVATNTLEKSLPVDPTYPIGVVPQPVAKVEQTPQASPMPTVVENEEWQLVRPMTSVQPLKSWKFEKDRNAVLLDLEKGRGYEVISAKDVKSVNQYKGKVNGMHRILLPYMSDDKITIEIRDMKSNKFIYSFEPPERLKQEFENSQNATAGNALSNKVVQVPATSVSVQTQSASTAFTETTYLPQEGFSLELRSGQYLSNELSRFLEQKFQWRLVWSRSTDVMVNHEQSIYIKDVNALTAWLSDNTPLNVLLNVKTKQMIVTE